MPLQEFWNGVQAIPIRIHDILHVAHLNLFLIPSWHPDQHAAIIVIKACYLLIIIFYSHVPVVFSLLADLSEGYTGKLEKFPAVNVSRGTK